VLGYYRGFSIHVYPEEESIHLARAIESRMISAGITWSGYHTEDIPGERMKLVQGTTAIYERKNLFILRNAIVPTVIIECGCIANPEEEKVLKHQDRVRRIVDAIHKGVADFIYDAERLGTSSRKK
jgi:N-acetylmuramoyl-L-alanine amidase